MSKGRRVAYCWTVTHSPDAAHCVATVITFVQLQYAVAEPVTVLQYVQFHHLPKRKATPLGFSQGFITVHLSKVIF